MNYRLNSRSLEQESVIKGVRHFKDRNDAMKYVLYKYGIDMKFVPKIGQIRANYAGNTYDRETGMITEAWTPAGKWSDDHDVIEIYRHPWISSKDRKLVEFVTYGDAYTYSYRYSREYKFKEEV